MLAAHARLVIAAASAFALAACSSPAADNNESPAPDRAADPPAILGTFDVGLDGRREAKWLPLTDERAGGGSTVELAHATEGAAGSAGSLRIRGDVPLKDFPFPYAGTRLQFGESTKDGKPPVRDLRAYQGIEFYARGDGKEYCVRAISSDVRDHNYHHYAFRAGPEWTKHRVRFDELVQFEWGRRVAWNGAQSEGLLITNYTAPGEEPGSIELYVDEIRFF
jgi:hypothetical protein